MQFSKQARECGNALIITIPKHIVKLYDINHKDLCTFEFIKNWRDGNGRQ